MEPITAAILAALSASASTLTTEGVHDAYEGLKAVIRRKWGASAPVSKAIVALEEDPTSKAQAAVLSEKVDAVKAAADPEVSIAVKLLLDQIKASGGAEKRVAAITVTITDSKVGIAGAEHVEIENFHMDG